MSRLAIIIPAYKNAYLNETLESIASQTCKDFTVYIGDDCSPYQLKEIVERFTDRITIKYARFENNIGAKDIVRQWSRCVELTTDEEWLWLFSDDDIMDPGCVESFFFIVDSKIGNYQLYRFNKGVIDANGNIIGLSPLGPEVESSEAMAYNLLLGKRGNVMPDQIFSRNIYQKSGGFVYTQYAQGADYAVSILFSKEFGICIIPNAKIYWRWSGQNITCKGSGDRSKIIVGHLQFIKWTLNHFTYLKNQTGEISYQMIKYAAKKNLIEVIIGHYKGISFRHLPKLVKLMHNHFEDSYTLILKDLFFILRRTSRSLNAVNCYIHRFIAISRMRKKYS